MLQILELFAHKVYQSFKKQGNFYVTLLFLNLYAQLFKLSHVRISQNVKGALI